MDDKRKSELRSKGAVVAWTCATTDGLGWLFYLKSLGDNKFSLIRQGVLEEKEKLSNITWIASNEKELGLLIITLTNGFKLNTVKIQKYYLVTYQEAIKQNRKVPILEKVKCPQQLRFF